MFYICDDPSGIMAEHAEWPSHRFPDRQTHKRFSKRVHTSYCLRENTQGSTEQHRLAIKAATENR